MANQCFFKQINPTGYEFLLQFISAEEISARCPCKACRSDEPVNLTSEERDALEEQFTNFILEVTGHTQASLEEALADFVHQKRVQEYVRYKREQLARRNKT